MCRICSPRRVWRSRRATQLDALKRVLGLDVLQAWPARRAVDPSRAMDALAAGVAQAMCAAAPRSSTLVWRSTGDMLRRASASPWGRRPPSVHLRRSPSGACARAALPIFFLRPWTALFRSPPPFLHIAVLPAPSPSSGRGMQNPSGADTARMSRTSTAAPRRTPPSHYGATPPERLGVDCEAAPPAAAPAQRRVPISLLQEPRRGRAMAPRHSEVEPEQPQRRVMEKRAPASLEPQPQTQKTGSALNDV